MPTVIQSSDDASIRHRRKQTAFQQSISSPLTVQGLVDEETFLVCSRSLVKDHLFKIQLLLLFSLFYLISPGMRSNDTSVSFSCLFNPYISCINDLCPSSLKTEGFRTQCRPHFWFSRPGLDRFPIFPSERLYLSTIKKGLVRSSI